MIHISDEIKERCQTLRDEVLEVIVNNFDYFREKPSHLAWAIMNFDMIHRASRMAYGACEDNANDKYREISAQLCEDDDNLFSDAWDVTQQEDIRSCYHDYNSTDEGEGNCGTPLASFAGYTTAQEEVRKDIRERITSLTEDKYIKLPISIYRARTEAGKLTTLANGQELTLCMRYGNDSDKMKALEGN